MKRCLLIWLVLLSAASLRAQNDPAFRQFYFNPYLSNPAFAGVNGYTEVSVLYRQQWLGFNNAPSAGGFTLQYPSQNKVSLGMSFLSQESVALRTSSAQASFAYRVPLSSNQFMFFGLSAIARYNDLAMDQDYSNDPTILNAAVNTLYADANFGFMYELGGLRIGFALPKLLGQKYFSPQNLVNTKYAQFRNQLYSVSYKFRSGNFSIEPYALYRVNRDLQSNWEVATLVYYREKIWLGTSYNNTQGVGFFLGMDIKDRLRVGYSFELPPVNKEFTNVNSHEIQLQLKIGKRREYKWASRFAKPQAEVAQAAATETKLDADTIDVKETPKVAVEQTKPAIDSIKVVEKPKDVIVKQEVVKQQAAIDGGKLVPGFYIIAGSFSSPENAKTLAAKLKRQGYRDAKTGSYYSTEMRHYVYVFYSEKREECNQILPQFRAYQSLKTAWILTVK